MNIAEFIRSKRHVACLQSNGIEAEESNQEGWIYGETGLAIDGPNSGVDCNLMMDRSEYSSTEMFPLESLLYEYGLEEGFITGPRWSQDEEQQWIILFQDAMPINYDDEGSERQVDADHRLWNHITKMFSQDVVDELVHESMRGHYGQAEFLPHVAEFVLGRELNRFEVVKKSGETK